MIKILLIAIGMPFMLFVLLATDPGFFTGLLVSCGVAFVISFLWHVLRPHFGAIARWLQFPGP